MSPVGSRARLLAVEALGADPTPTRLAALRREPLLIALAPELAESVRGQLLLVTVASLAARLFDFVGAIDFAVPPAARVSLGLPGLRRRRSLVGACGSFLRGLRPESGPRRLELGLAAGRSYYARAIAIGSTGAVPAHEVVCVDGAGWEAAVGPEPGGPPLVQAEEVPDALFNPFGPLLAAAWGVAELAKGLFRALAPDERAARFPALARPARWDVWSHASDAPSEGPRLQRVVRLDPTAVAGVGALGSAAVFALSQLAWHGRLELVDDDRLDASNLERVLTAGAGDVGRRKIDVARRALGVRPVARIAGRYGERLPRGARAGTLLVGVDSAAARRAITRQLPYAIYHGGTQGAELLVSRHVGFQGACLECLYPEVAGDRAAQACGRAPAVAAGPAATIGFVSAFCGFLMLAELVKDRIDPRREAPLDDARPAFRLDLLAAAPGPECVEAYVPRRDCFCRADAVRREIAVRRRGRAG